MLSSSFLWIRLFKDCVCMVGRGVECATKPLDIASARESGEGVTRRMVECALYELIGRLGECAAVFGRRWVAIVRPQWWVIGRLGEGPRGRRVEGRMLVCEQLRKLFRPSRARELWGGHE